VPFEIADPSKTITGKILGVNSIEKEARCSLCKRKAQINDDGKVYCEPCDFKTSKGKSIMSWFVKLRLVAEGKDYRLAVKDFPIRDFIVTCTDLSPNCCEQELEEFLLETEDTFQVTYDDSQSLITKMTKV